MEKQPKERKSHLNEVWCQNLRDAIDGKIQGHSTKTYSQKDVADMTGISGQMINYYYNGKRKISFEHLVKIAKALDVSTDFILGKTSFPSPDEVDINIFKETGLNETAITNLRKIMSVEITQIKNAGYNEDAYFRGEYNLSWYSILCDFISSDEFFDIITYIGQACCYPIEKSIANLSFENGRFCYKGIFGREYLKYKAQATLDILMNSVIEKNMYKEAK